MQIFKVKLADSLANNYMYKVASAPHQNRHRKVVQIRANKLSFLLKKVQ